MMPRAQTRRSSNLTVSRSLVTPGLPLDVTADVTNAGPGEFSGAAELLVDGAAGVELTAELVGPIPAGGRVPLHFRTSLIQPGSHLLAVRLSGGDGLEAGHLRAVPVQVARGDSRAAGEWRAGGRAVHRRDRLPARRTGAIGRRDAAVSDQSRERPGAQTLDHSRE